MCFLPADECKAKWKSLVDYYREWLKTVADMTRSGSAAKVPGKTWKWSQVMSFMRPHMAKRPTSGNMGASAATSQGNLHLNLHVHALKLFLHVCVGTDTCYAYFENLCTHMI